MKYLLIFLIFICIFTSLKAAQEQSNIKITPQNYNLLSKIIKPNQINSYNAMDIVEKTDFLSKLQTEIDSIYSDINDKQMDLSPTDIINPKVPYEDIEIDVQTVFEISIEFLDLEISKLIRAFLQTNGAPRKEIIEIRDRFNITFKKASGSPVDGISCCTVQ